MLPVERKGCRRKGSWTKDQLLVNKTILEDSKHKHRNLVMAWVDYKKAYDMVPHSWIIESLKLAQVAPNVIDFVERPMRSWNAKLTSCGQTLEEAYSMATAYHEEGYKYLGTLDLDKVKEQQMKDTFRNEYMRRLKLVMKSKLNGRKK